LIKLLSALVIAGIIISALFQNWYSAVVSLGLISLILGFALQTPISSFIGWLYIILRNPFRVGDRIQIDTFKGDVVEVGYLDTTLWEFGGDYLTSDLPTGRLIRFPNSLVLSGAVFNYSWGKFPYIWNEIPFYVAYESDFDYVSETLRKIAKEELGDHMLEDIERLKALINDTAIDEIKIREYPFVTFRTNANTWVESTLIYLVPPRQASTIRSNILTKGVAALLTEPDRVLFPKGPNR
jgi:small-conductance mechanosensitive channel